MNSEQTFFLGDPSSAVSNAFLSVAHHFLSSCGQPLIWSHCPRQSHQYHHHYFYSHHPHHHHCSHMVIVFHISCSIFNEKKNGRIVSLPFEVFDLK